ncbi:hypothetical protein L228DRAFT_284718 [Xylona heveae TC161]|uniref:Protein kinase domain-containing protein n=1 Tax=Xylona heveae (strain CBS 132557 / TC161) TaxID=1328760 RepID=A0A165FBA1_XYLHT|nr:hypothetical protein L228DRAFT_284718 [Xylona heveae TC161]KZF20784.1 hypothetical protein L228DRAFT_284718 [Xylona heveae TC161]
MATDAEWRCFPEFGPRELNFNAVPPGATPPRRFWTFCLNFAPSEKKGEMIVFSAQYGNGDMTHDLHEREDDSLEQTKKFYGVLATLEPPSHPNFQKYFGTTPQGWVRLEMPECRIIEFFQANPKARMPAGTIGADKPNFIYYRWAMQLLAALSFLHKHEFFHTQLYLDKLWLRSDLSLVLCNLTEASRRGNWDGCYSDPPISCALPSDYPYCSEDQPESWHTPKHDLFAFGTVLYLIQIETVLENPEDPLTPEQEEVALSLPTGAITRKCWDQLYTNAEEVVADLRAVIEAEGIEVNEQNQVITSEGLGNLMAEFNPPPVMPDYR